MTIAEDIKTWKKDRKSVMFCQESVSQSSEGNQVSKPCMAFKGRMVFNSKEGCSLKDCLYIDFYQLMEADTKTYRKIVDRAWGTLN